MLLVGAQQSAQALRRVIGGLAFLNRQPSNAAHHFLTDVRICPLFQNGLPCAGVKGKVANGSL